MYWTSAADAVPLLPGMIVAAALLFAGFAGVVFAARPIGWWRYMPWLLRRRSAAPAVLLGQDVLETPLLRGVPLDPGYTPFITAPEHADDDSAVCLDELINANQCLREQLENAESALKQQASQLAEYASAACTDALTELPNRRAFDEELRRRFADWQRQGRAFAVLLIDVDHFKRFNDQFGHQAGDRVLFGVGRVLASTVRASDLAVRFGGEEFAAILSAADLGDTRQVAERVRSAIQRSTHRHEELTLHVTVSCGLAHVIGDETIESIIKRADTALYASKSAGRNFAYWHNGTECLPITPRDARAGMAGANSALQKLEHHREFPLIANELRRRLREITSEPTP